MITKNSSYKIIAYVLILTGLILGSIFLYQVTASPDYISVTGEGTTSLDGMTIEEYVNSIPSTDLTADENESLNFMREEEKLAYDVYETLYIKWGINIFDNIKKAELTHMDAVKILLDKYQIGDPASGEVGVFTNQDLQDLYDSLVAQGEISEIEALKVGAAIEEIDILDLVKYLKTTEKDDIIAVYNMLLLGSRNHLRSFVNNIEKIDDSYTPQYLIQAEYDAIIDGEMEKGSQPSSQPSIDLTLLYFGIIVMLVGIVFMILSRKPKNVGQI